MGMMAPVQTAWRMRPSKSTGNTGASAAAREPTMNTHRKLMKSCRVVKRPIRYAESGMTTASTSE